MMPVEASATNVFPSESTATAEGLVNDCRTVPAAVEPAPMPVAPGVYLMTCLLAESAKKTSPVLSTASAAGEMFSPKLAWLAGSMVAPAPVPIPVRPSEPG